MQNGSAFKAKHVIDYGLSIVWAAIAWPEQPNAGSCHSSEFWARASGGRSVHDRDDVFGSDTSGLLPAIVASCIGRIVAQQPLIGEQHQIAPVQHTVIVQVAVGAPAGPAAGQ